ncbi:MAG TPA: ATP-binding protein [Tepidisphaeraceae bacterium]|nr:ATP-binding protein [Tepidisphaeraceae bacterium]
MRTSGFHSRKNEKPAAALRNGALRFTISSDFVAGREVQKAILDDVARHRYNDHAAFAIKLALEEALINAIKHGNKLDPAKKVRVTAKVTDAACHIEIEDEGPGFDRKSVPDPCAEENLEKCSGRGILLMESYMNSVAWDRGGRRVRMSKKNEPDVLPRKK